MKKTVYLSMIGMILLAGCGGDNGSPTDDLPITIHPWIQTRATESDFQPGDEIGLSIKLENSNTYVENARLTYQGSYFQSQEVKWYTQGKGRFEAYYPYMDSQTETFEINQDQTTEEGYGEMDLLFAVAEDVQPNERGVSLRFTHAMSRVVVSVTNRSGCEITGITIDNTKEKATIDWENRNVVVGMHFGLRSIKAQRIEADTYRAIIAPQKASIGVTVHLDNADDVSVTMESETFQAGKSYRVSLTVEEQGVSQGEITTEGDIDGWVDGGNLQNT